MISSSDVHTWRVRKQQSVISSLDVHTWMVLKLMEPHFIVNLYFNIQIPSKPQKRCCSQKCRKREHQISWSNYSIESFDMTRLLTAVKIIIAPKENMSYRGPFLYFVIRFGLKSDSTHHFFRNACTKSGSLRFSQFSSCWLILSVYILMSFDFPFVRLFGVR